MKEELLIDTTIPLWAILISLISAIGLGIWNVIKIYFSDKSKDNKIDEMEKQIAYIANKGEMVFKKQEEDFNKRIEEVKQDIKDMKLSFVYMRDTLVEVKTYTKLLVGDRFKKDKEE